MDLGMTDSVERLVGLLLAKIENSISQQTKELRLEMQEIRDMQGLNDYIIDSDGAFLVDSEGTYIRA